VTVTAPPRPPHPGDPLEREEVEALIEEARQRQRKRRWRYGAFTALAALVGVTTFILLSAAEPSRSTPPAASPAPAGSAAGSRIAFTRGPGSGNVFTEADVELWTMNGDGSDKRLLARIAHHGGGAWSPDGTKIVFARQQDAEHHGLYVVNADGSGLQRLTRGADGGAAWSPDGHAIAFVRGTWNTEPTYIDESTEIWVMNADGSGQRRLTFNGVQDFGPAWSPDGTKIAWESEVSSDNTDIFIMNPDGSGKQNLTRSPSSEGHFAWSPDGSKIGFRSEDGLVVMDADGRDRRRLVDISGLFFSWSPDGRKIAFLGRAFGPFAADLYVVNADGSELRNLKSRPQFDEAPVWSPDGEAIAFVRSWDIYAVNVDGSNVRNLTHRPGVDLSPVWSLASGR
jgi:Tol biopolymer transport system component